MNDNEKFSNKSESYVFNFIKSQKLIVFCLITENE